MILILSLNNSMIDGLTVEKLSERIKNTRIQVVDDHLFPHLIGRSPKQASVLIPLTRIDGQWAVLFTTRTDKVENHKGQVSFPGGAREDTDRDPIFTALRETQEEIGLEPKDVTILGSLPSRRTVSNYIVTPVVGVFPFPYPFVESHHEVNRIFFVPLRWLANSNNWTSFSYDETSNIVIKFAEYDHEIIWGITAKILVDLVRSLEIIQ